MKKVFFLILIFCMSLSIFSQYSFDSTFENNIKIIYQNKNYTLLIPLYVYETELTGSILSVLKYGGRPIFVPGEKITIIDVKFKSDGIVFKFYSFDRTKKASIKIKRPISKSALNSLLSKIFSRRPLKNAKSSFIENVYQQLFIKISNTLSMKADKLEREVIKNFALYEELTSKLKEKKFEIEKLNKEVDSLKGENKDLVRKDRELLRKITNLKNELSALKEKVKILSKNNAQTENLVSNVISYKKRLDEKIREISINLGIKKENVKSIRLLSEIETEITNLSMSNKTMSRRIEEDSKKISDLEKNISSLDETVQSLKSENGELKRKIKILSTSDKHMARKLISIEHEKNVFQSKLLSKKIIKIKQEKVLKDGVQEIKCEILFRKTSIGKIVIKSPTFLKKGTKNKIFADIEITNRKIEDRTFKKLSKYLKNFPQIDLVLKKVRGKVKVKNLQSPENSNSNTYIWEIESNEAINDIYLSMRGEVESIDREKIPIFEVPITIKPLSIEKTLISYFQPIPLGIGIILGLLLALPFFIKVRKDGVKAKKKEKSKSLYFGDKEL